jgi:ParB-like nuclease domain
MTGQETAPPVETRRIEDIIIGNRFRKDFGDIDSLAQSINETGLLQPVGITPDNKLIYGSRRIEAYKRLGRTEIPVIIIPLEDIIKGELIENTARKDFTFSERQTILQEIEARRIGHRVPKQKVSNLQTFQKDNKGKPSVNIVADYTGISPRQLSKEKDVYVHIKSNPEVFGYLIEELDKGDITVNAAVGKIRAHLDEKRKLEQAAIVKKRRGEQQEEKQKRQQPRQRQQQQQQTQIYNLGDYDAAKRDSYDRQTLYNVIDWLLEQNRMLREANRNLRANNKRAANDNSTTTSNKGGADV